MSHRKQYIVNGVTYPSVTEVLGDQPKPWLDKWRQKWGKRAEQKTIAAVNIGIAFHKLAESRALCEPIELPSNFRLLHMLVNFDKWLKKTQFLARETELHVASDLYKYHGTFDAVGYMNKGIVICDWKTSSGIYPDMKLQLAAYAQAYFEQTNVKITRGIIVQVSKDKPYHRITVAEYKLGKQVLNKFLKRLNEYNARRA